LNKFLKRILNGLEPVLTNQELWKILSELEKPHKFTTIQPTGQSTSSARPKGFEKVRDDFESRVTRQKILNEHDSKLFRLQDERIKRVNTFNKILNFLNPLGRFNNRADLNKYLSKSGLPRNKTNSAKYIDNVSSNADRLKFKSFGVGKNPNLMVFAESSGGQSNSVPTPSIFSADYVSGEIQNIHIAFNQFKQRMTQIGNQYIGEKREYFFKQLNQCSIDRFKALSTEIGKLTIYGVREAETMLQSEFEGYHEPNSITRPTKEEYQEGNILDGRFRKGRLSGESNTLNEQYTDADAKVLVSDETLQHQADQRRILGHKNPNKMSMYEQGKNMGSSIVVQKHKHCNPSKPELPSSPDNVKHIINALELIPSET
jgi:hypothetical protein